MTIGDRIKGVRGDLSREEFALKIGTDKSTVQRYEKEYNIPKGDILLRIHEEFGTDINWLLTGEGESPVGVDDQPFISEPGDINYRTIDNSFGTTVDALKEIFDSHDPALIDAVRANLSVFRLYARKDHQIEQQSQDIKEVQKKYDELKKQFDSLEKRGVGSVGAGSGSHAHYGDATRKKES